MKSGTSLFNKGLAANLLKRCWPLWTTYLVMLILMLPVGIRQQLNNTISWCLPEETAIYVERYVLTNGCAVVYLSFGVGIVAVMAMFSFLYNTRTCGMLCSLPLKRETVFFTAWFTGLAPMLAVDLLTAILALAALSGYAGPDLMLRWLGLAVMGNIAFYGFASFCAMLTGSIIILPLVYVVLNLTAYVAEAAAAEIFKSLVYGCGMVETRLTWLSPIVMLMRELRVENDLAYDSLGDSVLTGVTLKGTGYLMCLAIAGLVFSLMALLLYRKRKMETSTDTVAIPILKPVFKYCMALGCGLVLPNIINILRISESFKGTALAVYFGALMVLSAVVGYFAAEMLISKTVRVFNRGWGGCLICCGALLLGLIAAETDIFGYEKWLPDMEQVDHVELSSTDLAELYEEENLTAARELHGEIIRDKAENEAAVNTNWTGIVWVMKDGSRVERNYNLSMDEEQCYDKNSNLRKSMKLVTCLEAVLSRLPSQPVKAENVTCAEINIWSEDSEGLSRSISGEEAEALYNECILPEIYMGRLGNTTWLDESCGIKRDNGTNIYIETRDRAAETGSNRYNYRYYSVTATVDSYATNERVSQLVGAVG